MKEKWTLKRTIQCAKCPWRQAVNPHDIPDYKPEKHRTLDQTIATEGDLTFLADDKLHVMACHEGREDYCVGWLENQLGPGNNIGMRLAMRNCANVGQLRVVGPQHETFEDTLPE